jgi:hypothetical protein
MLSRARRQDLLDHDSVEQILRHEIASVLRKMDLSHEEEEDIERLGYSLVDRIVLGPISEALVCVEIRVSQGGLGDDRALSASEAPPSEMKNKR